MEPSQPRSDALSFVGRVFALIERFSHSNPEVIDPKLFGRRPCGDTSPQGVVSDHEVKKDQVTEEDGTLNASSGRRAWLSFPASSAWSRS